ncbi:MAG: hypothetical protein ACRCZF_10280 [Gemmataceae bacterium]
MGENSGFFRAVIRDGILIPDAGTPLIEGMTVVCRVLPPADRQNSDDLSAWEQAGDEAWNSIDWGEGELARDSG